MPTLTLLRHGESVGNASAIPNFMYDSPLSDVGKEQVKNISGHFDIVLCSPMLRAKQTLSCSKITYGTVETIMDAREKMRDKGDFLEGEDFTRQETIEEFISRMKKLKFFLKQYCKTNINVLLICHYWVMASLLTTEMDLPPEEFFECLKKYNIPNATLKEITI